MQIRYLAYFKCIAETHNITEAAKRLFISQSQLSRIIFDIEKEVGVPLFERSKSGMELNRAGRVYLQYVVQVLKFYEEGGIRARDAFDTGNIHFTFGTNIDFMVHGMVERVAERIPNARFHQASATSNALLNMVKSGEIGSMVTPKLVDEPRMHSDSLARDRLLIIYPDGSKYSGKDVIPIADLTHERWVAFARGYGLADVVSKIYKDLGLSSGFSTDDVVIETTDAYAVIEYVRHGMGISLMPRSFVLRNPYCRDHCVELEHEFSFDIAATWSFDHILRDLDVAYHDILEEYFQEYVNI
jgi:LysR family transcriptional activator of glutamate synthase operon